jgi:hypothetical protein
MISRESAFEYGRLGRANQEWFKVSEPKTSMLDAIRQLCATFQSTDIAPPSTMMMQSESDF